MQNENITTYVPTVDEAIALYRKALRAAREASTYELWEEFNILAERFRYFIHSVDGLGA